MSVIDTRLARIEAALDHGDALAEQIDAWITRSLDTAPAVEQDTRARVARLLAEEAESA